MKVHNARSDVSTVEREGIAWVTISWAGTPMRSSILASVSVFNNECNPTMGKAQHIVHDGKYVPL